MSDLPKPDYARNIRIISHTDQGGRPDGVQLMVHRGFAYIGADRFATRPLLLGPAKRPSVQGATRTISAAIQFLGLPGSRQHDHELRLLIWVPVVRGVAPAFP
jgi:hypothetical protein